MGKDSAISWTDHTFNPWIGCQKVSPRWGSEGQGGIRTKTSPANWREPLKWNLAAEQAGVRARVFCASLADVFEYWVGPVLDHNGNRLWRHPDDQDRPEGSPQCRPTVLQDLRRDLFRLIDRTPWLDWLVLTKRPENIGSMLPALSAERQAENQQAYRHSSFRPNVWLGTSVGTQRTADIAIPRLQKIYQVTPVLFLSCEPLLERVDVTEWLRDVGVLLGGRHVGRAGIGWLIAGGESQVGARPMHPDWVRSLRDQCSDAGVPFHFKQWGEWCENTAFAGKLRDAEGNFPQGLRWGYLAHDGAFEEIPAGQAVSVRPATDHRVCMVRCGVDAAGRLLDGVVHDAVPVTEGVRR